MILNTNRLKGEWSSVGNSRSVSSDSEKKQSEHLLFLIRKNPDSVGGVQRHSSRLCEGLSGKFAIEKVIWHGPEWAAPFYFSKFYSKSISNGAKLIHCDDAVTSLIGAKIKNKTGKKVVATVHGLDVILPIPWYRKQLKRSFDAIDKIVCVSQATAREVQKLEISPDKIEVIPNAAEKTAATIAKNDALYDRIEKILGISLKGKKVLLSLGRPLKRKGFDKFIPGVFINLPDDYVYIVAGPKPSPPSWIKPIRPLIGGKNTHLLMVASGGYTVHDDLVRLSRHPRVFYLNNVSEELRNDLFAVSDLFIMPNRAIEGDMEGFGIVALEAAIRGIPVIATGIEGITDAVIDGQNGYCIPEGDYSGMADKIKSLLDNPEYLAILGQNAIEFTQRQFAIEKIADQYEKVFTGLLDK